MYDDNELKVMSDFCDRGIWLIAQKNKGPVHPWKDCGLTMPQVEFYIDDGCEIGFILDTAGIVLVDLDNPLELTDEGLAETASNLTEEQKTGPLSPLDIYKKNMKGEWKSYSEDDSADILDGFIQIGELGPDNVMEISMSGYGLHWYYRCDDADGIHFSSPNIEIFGNKKPVYTQKWEAVAGVLDMEPVPLKAITDFWLPIEKQLNLLTPPPKPEKRIYYSYSGGKVEYDYDTYLANSQKAQAGRNFKLWIWVAKAASHQDEDEIYKAEAWARQAGLDDSEIAKTVASARSTGEKDISLPYRRRQDNLAKAKDLLQNRRAA